MNYVDDLLYKAECFKIIGICMKVHTKLGAGFREIVYNDALEIEFIDAGIPYEREKPLGILYNDKILSKKFRADFFLYDSIILESKSLKASFYYDNFLQTLNYLKATNVKLGLLVNFGESKLKFKRVICTFQRT